MPMIDVYAATGTFADPHRLAADLARTVMEVEQVPDIRCSARTPRRSSTTCRRRAVQRRRRLHYVRVQVLTNAGALDRDKQLAVVAGSPTWSPRRPATPGCATAPGCC